MQVVKHYCLRHYLKKISELLFLKYYTVRKPYISDKLWRELRQYIYYPVIFPGEDNGIIYIPTKDISFVSYALQGEDSSGRGFSWGDNTLYILPLSSPGKITGLYIYC